MTTHRYILECVESHVVHYMPFIGENFLFMDDNARPHMARIVVRYLEQVGIRLLPWPANSPDLNPIEHVWDFLGKRVRRRQLRPETLNGSGGRMCSNTSRLHCHSHSKYLKSFKANRDEVLVRFSVNRWRGIYLTVFS
jgi:transposase